MMNHLHYKQSFGVSGPASVQIPYANNHVWWLLESSCFLDSRSIYTHIFTERCEKGASQMALVVKSLPANTRDTGGAGSIPGSGRSRGEGHGYPLQCSCLENPHRLQSIGLQRVGHD